MTSGRAHCSTTSRVLCSSTPIRLTDRFGATRRAVVGWNPETAGFEAALGMFCTHPAAGPGPMGGGGGHGSMTLGSLPISTLPATVVVGRQPGAPAVSAPAPGRYIGAGGGPTRRSLCLTVDSLMDAFRFEGFRFDAAATERMSDMTHRAERCHGPTLLHGSTSANRHGPRLRLRVHHPLLAGDLPVFDGRWSSPIDLLEPARCVIELCVTRWWTADERDLAMALALEVLAGARDEFCLSVADIALWCLTDRPIPARSGDCRGTGWPSESGQLRLAL